MKTYSKYFGDLAAGNGSTSVMVAFNTVVTQRHKSIKHRYERPHHPFRL